MEYNEITKLIRQFNTDNTVALFREKYATKSFFDITAKSRSETTHSAFITWLLSNMTICTDNNNKPIVRFLDLLVDRAEEQAISINNQNQLMEASLANAIITRQVKISAIDGQTEYSIAALAEQAVADYSNDPTKQNLLMNIAQNVQDRADMVIDCAVEGIGDIKHLQIIVENKIDSQEGKSKSNTKVDLYDKATQTDRYYMASKRQSNSVLQLYVYLSPMSDTACKNEHFIKITYQDILDYLIEPTLLSQSLSPRVRMYVEDYKDELTFPHMTVDSYHPCLAFARNEYTESLSTLWKNFRTLMFNAMAVTNNIKLFCVEGHYYQDLNKAKEVSLKKLINYEKEWLIQNEFISETAKEDWDMVENGSFWFNTRKPITINRLRNQGVQETYTINPDEMDEVSAKILLDFWETNYLFIASLSSYLYYSPYVDDKILIDAILQKRDTSKYYIYFEGKKLNERAIGKGETAFLIVKTWAKHMIDQGELVDLTKIRQYFPISMHKYYKSGKWFKYLIYPYNPQGDYEYDSPSLIGTVVSSGWDFYADDRHNFRLSNGQEVTILKMWRKENLEDMIRYVLKKQDNFSRALKIVRG